MSIYDAAFVNSELSKPTSIFGLRLWVVIGIFVGSTIVLLLFLLSLCITSRRSHNNNNNNNSKLSLSSNNNAVNADVTPPISKEIKEIIPAVHQHNHHHHHHRPINGAPEIQIDIGKSEHRVVFSDKAPSSGESLRSNNYTYGSSDNNNGNVNNSNSNSGNNHYNHNTTSYGGPEVLI